jgi:outer membrane protein TolC
MKILALLTAAFLAVGKSQGASKTPPKDALSLAGFLDQVKSKHQGYRGAKLGAEGAADTAGEAALITLPSVFFDFKWADDRSLKSNPAMGKRTLFDEYQAGIMETTPFGLTGKLYYDVQYTDVSGASSLFMPLSTYYEAHPVFEGSLSLWRNLFGKEVRANQDALEAGNKATRYAESFNAKMALAEAENAYWRLALARRLKVISTESLERAQKLRDWNARRARTGLGDRSDLLQAEGNLKLRKLELQSAVDEERNAALMFNSQRGIDSDKVGEALELLPDSKSEFYSTPEKSGMRDDVQAALENTRAARAVATAEAEKNSPTLELYGQWKYGGLDHEYSKAEEEAFKSDYPMAAIGVRFNMPLDVIDLANAHGGHNKEAAAADYKYQRKVFEQQRDWNDLTKRYSEARKRLALAEAFEDSQKEKLEYERKRHHQGRTTTFMVLQFEQDYATAESTRLKIQGEMLGLVAQLKTYGESL